MFMELIYKILVGYFSKLQTTGICLFNSVIVFAIRTNNKLFTHGRFIYLYVI